MPSIVAGVTSELHERLFSLVYFSVDFRLTTLRDAFVGLPTSHSLHSTGRLTAPYLPSLPQTLTFPVPGRLPPTYPTCGLTFVGWFGPFPAGFISFNFLVSPIVVGGTGLQWGFHAPLPCCCAGWRAEAFNCSVGDDRQACHCYFSGVQLILCGCVGWHRHLPLVVLAMVVVLLFMSVWREERREGCLPCLGWH